MGWFDCKEFLYLVFKYFVWEVDVYVLIFDVDVDEMVVWFLVYDLDLMLFGVVGIVVVCYVGVQKEVFGFGFYFWVLCYLFEGLEDG